MDEKRKALSGCICAAFSETMYGLSYVFTRQAVTETGSFALLGWRFITAFVLMFLLVRLKILPVCLKKKNLKPVLLISLLSPILYYVGETFGIAHTSASESGIFLAVIPVVCVMASTFLLKRRPSARQIIGIGITLAGVLVTVLALGISASLSIIGYSFLILTILSYAFFSVLVEKTTDFTDLEITYVMLASGAFFFGITALIQAVLKGDVQTLLMLPLTNVHFLSAVLFQGIGCSILAFFLTNRALSLIGVNQTSSFAGVSTVVSILAGILILKETLSAVQLIGAAIILAGIYTANSTGKTGRNTQI